MATLAHDIPVTAHHPAKKKSLVWDLMTTVDHKKIGIMYGVTALIFMMFGGIEATMIRIQLMKPENTFVSAQTYNSLFTMHGTTMVFMVGMPIAVAMFNFIVPLQIGARDVAFPRLNALSYWIFLFGAIFMNMRCPGMKLMRMPLFTWMAFITSFLIATALPVFAVALFMITFDRWWGTNFF